MDRIVARMITSVTALTLLGVCGSALAAEPAPPPAAPATISVQLDGRALTFDGAAPQVREGRTFLPLRAVFEAMGAEVSYDPASNTVSAARDGAVVTMTLGSTAASVTREGVTTALTMDVAPYAADNAAYVPVRFAAQAFGCAVGWDQEEQTVILVDTEKLLRDTLSQYEYTYLEEYLAYNEQFQTGAWEMDAAFQGGLSLMGTAPLAFDGAMEGITSGLALSADMNMKMDMAAFLTEAAGAAGETLAISPEDQAVLDGLKNQGIDLEMRGDLEEGILYLSLGGSFVEDVLGTAPNTWYRLDLGAAYDELGVDYAALLDASRTLDAQVLLSSALSGVSLDDRETSYTLVSNLVDGIAGFLADSSFVKEADGYTTSYTLEQNGASLSLSFHLVRGEGGVTGYLLTMDLSVRDSAGAEPVQVLHLSSGMDADNRLAASYQFGVPGFMELAMDITGGYTAANETPETTPPAGAAVVPYEQMA